MVKKDISSDNTWREAYWEIAFWCVTSSHRVPHFPSWKSLLTLLSSVLQSDIWELILGYGEKGNNLRSNSKEAFWETAFQCVNATHRFTRLSSVCSLLTQFSENLQWDTSESNEAYSDKGSILRWKLERRFVRNFLVMCEFISELHLCFMQQSTISVFEEPEEDFFESLWGLRW